MSNHHLSKIGLVSIELTNICNMTCDYCPKSLDELNHKINGISIDTNNEKAHNTIEVTIAKKKENNKSNNESKYIK